MSSSAVDRVVRRPHKQEDFREISQICVILSCSLILSIAIVKEVIAMLVKFFPYLIGICLNYVISWLIVCALIANV